jgi:hypothetical protein
MNDRREEASIQPDSNVDPRVNQWDKGIVAFISGFALAAGVMDDWFSVSSQAEC